MTTSFFPQSSATSKEILVQPLTLEKKSGPDGTNKKEATTMLLSQNQNPSEVWTKYVELSATTAIYGNGKPKNVRSDYVILGLISEIGEVAGKYKKLIRDGILDKQAVIGELGDVYWYLAAYCREEDLGKWMPQMTPSIIPSQENPSMTGTIVTAAQSATYLFHSGNRMVNLDIIGRAMCILASCFETDVPTILERNLEKLLDRKDRNVIGGNGDTR
jgi:hypothetical protein